MNQFESCKPQLGEAMEFWKDILYFVNKQLTKLQTGFLLVKKTQCGNLWIFCHSVKTILENLEIVKQPFLQFWEP